MTKANILRRPSSKLEYIWLDGYTPTANLRSKTKIEADFGGKLKDCPSGPLMEALRFKPKGDPLIAYLSQSLFTLIPLEEMDTW